MTATVATEAPTTVPTFIIGQTVHALPEYMKNISGSEVFKVDKITKGKYGPLYSAVRVGGGVGIKVPGYVLVAAAEGAEEAALAAEPMPISGSVVTVTHPRFDKDTLHVVLGQGRGVGTFKVVLLGGSSEGGYWPSLPGSILTVVDPSRLSVTG